jgi:hypothetical protein
MLLIASGCTTQKEIEKTKINVKLIFEAENYYKELNVKVEKNSNAFDVLNANAKIEFKQYSFGKFIESINGIKPKENEYWAIYVNGKYSEKGIELIQLTDDTELKFKIEKFSN